METFFENLLACGKVEFSVMGTDCWDQDSGYSFGQWLRVNVLRAAEEQAKAGIS